MLSRNCDRGAGAAEISYVDYKASTFVDFITRVQPGHSKWRCSFTMVGE